MVNRWLGILLGGAMLLANAGVFVRDVLPRWMPNDPPPNDAQMLELGQSRFVQLGIFDDEGRRIGAHWTRSHRKLVGDFVTVSSTTLLGPIELPAANLPRVRVDSELIFRGSTQRLDDLDFRLHGLGFPFRVRGEAMPTGEFACTWRIASETGSFMLAADAPAALGDVIRPFDRLPQLEVGQTWQIKLLNPLAAFGPPGELAVESEPVLIEVTGRQRIVHGGQQVETFVVEGGGATAYVADDGRVLRQEVQAPLLGTLLLLDEPYDQHAREEALRRFP
jgi:hypothetical protein